MGPVVSKLFETQNALRLTNSAILHIKLISLGIMNGLVDERIQMPYYPRFANNNTYGIAAIDLMTMLNTLTDLNSPGGCDELMAQCRSALGSDDPNGYGDVSRVNAACMAAQQRCSLIINVFARSGLSVYDIRQKNRSFFPSNAYVEYLNLRDVQRSIGAAVNYTDSSRAVFNAHLSTGDVIREDPLRDLAYLLSQGIRVSLIYGDADYICNWFGGEAVANALASKIPGYALAYNNAGYAGVVVNATYVGGAVRQYGNLSFVRVYDAGHQVPSYQPETAFTIFTRVIKGTSLSTGEKITLSNYRSSGPSRSNKTNKAPASSSNPMCWVRLANSSCTTQQISSILAGKGTVLNGVWYESAGNYQRPTSTIVAGKPGSPLPTLSGGRTQNGRESSIVPVIGVYTATGTPSPSNNVATHNLAQSSFWGQGIAILLIFQYIMQ
jgi:hypothetical protein